MSASPLDPKAVARMIARRIRGGYDEAQSRAMLAELTAAHSGTALALALQYNGFTR